MLLQRDNYKILLEVIIEIKNILRYLDKINKKSYIIKVPK